MLSIRQLREETDLVRAFPVMNQLRPHISDETVFIANVRELVEKEGYILFALEEDGHIQGLCGAQPMYTLYYERCLWVCDLVTDEKARSHGYGRRLLGYVEQWARENGFREIALSSGVQRKDAHRFYLDTMDYSMNSYSFIKKL